MPVQEAGKHTPSDNCHQWLSHKPLETGSDEDPIALFIEHAAHPTKNAALNVK